MDEQQHDDTTSAHSRKSVSVGDSRTFREYQRRIVIVLRSWSQHLWQRRILLMIAISTSAALIYDGWNLNSWKFAYVGDEWSFYIMAQTIAARHLWVNPFNLHGVYGFNGMLGSVYQAIFLLIFGTNNGAWRLSNIILIIPISIFFFRWIRDMLGTRVAVCALLLLQASFYIANYLKIGYVNAQSFALFVIVLAIASQFVRQPSLGNAAWLGSFLGIAFYIYIGPLFPLFIIPTLLPLLSWRGDKLRHAVRGVLVIISTYLSLVIPGLFTSGNVFTLLQKTSIHREYHDNQQMFINIQHNFLLFYHNYDYYYNHFIIGPYLDGLSALLATLGMAVALVQIRHSGYRTIVLTYIVVAVIIGLTSPYTYTAATRGIFFIPFGAAFAGIALAAATRLLQRIPSPHGWVMPLAADIMASLLIFFIWQANIYQSQVGVFHEAGYGATNLIMRSVQTAHTQHRHKLIAVISGHYPYRNVYHSEQQWPILQQAYGMQDVQMVLLDPSQITCSALQQQWIVFFTDDATARDTLARLSCPATMPNMLIALDAAYPL